MLIAQPPRLTWLQKRYMYFFFFQIFFGTSGFFVTLPDFFLWREAFGIFLGTSRFFGNLRIFKKHPDLLGTSGSWGTSGSFWFEFRKFLDLRIFFWEHPDFFHGLVFWTFFITSGSFGNLRIFLVAIPDFFGPPDFFNSESSLDLRIFSNIRIFWERIIFIEYVRIFVFIYSRRPYF